MPLDTLRLLICSFCELWMVSGEEEGLSRPQHRGTCCPPTMAFFSPPMHENLGMRKLKSGKSAGHELLQPKHLKHGWCTVYIFSACICILDPQLAICKQVWIHCTALDVYTCVTEYKDHLPFHQSVRHQVGVLRKPQGSGKHK